MKSMKTFVAVAALVALSVNAQAGLFSSLKGCGASKCCDCAPSFQPDCCKPTITRPCHTNIYNYQRSCAKPFSCLDGCAPTNGCAPVGNGCGPATNCAPAAGPAACAPATNACAPGAGACADACNGNGAACCPAAGPDCGAPCDDECCPCVDPCEIAELIYLSQTACYAKDRRKALKKLGHDYDCACNPEIMSAFVYGLNDADERVRAEAADQIGRQTRKNSCCCSPCVISALTCALADCDRRVRRLAEKALENCGFEVVDGCCEQVCDATCAPGCAPVGGMPAAVPSAAPMNGNSVPAPATEGTAPAPAPPVEDGDRAYFPRQIPQQTARPVSIRESLSNLFSLNN